MLWYLWSPGSLSHCMIIPCPWKYPNWNETGQQRRSGGPERSQVPSRPACPLEQNPNPVRSRTEWFTRTDNSQLHLTWEWRTLNLTLITVTLLIDTAPLCSAFLCCSCSSSCWRTSSCWPGSEWRLSPPCPSSYTSTSGIFAKTLQCWTGPRSAWTHASMVRPVSVSSPAQHRSSCSAPLTSVWDCWHCCFYLIVRFICFYIAQQNIKSD